MTTELEKQFFDTFGIEPYDRYYNCKDNLDGECTIENTCDCCEQSEDVYCYPEITDRILLELICIANEHESFSATTNIKNIQARTLRMLLRTDRFYKNYYGYDREHKKLVKQVRTLFEEG